MVFKNNKKFFTYFSLKILLLSLLTASLFSAFIYFEYFNMTNKLLNTIFAISALTLLLILPKKALFGSGFFIGILWFYWIGYSFEYQNVGYLTPFISLFFGFVYMLFFGFIAISNKTFIRAGIIFLLSFVEPMDFNWLQIELLFINSYIGIEKYHLLLILMSGIMIIEIKNKFKFLAIIPILLSFYTPKMPSLPVQPLQIKLIQTQIKQEDKWKPSYLNTTLHKISSHIQKAIQENYDVVVLPESVFPLYLNKDHFLLAMLKTYSQKITIIAGALYTHNHQHFNVTYMFYKGKSFMAKKVTLVPFGEYIPLPKFAQDFINNMFFSGTSDFVGASKPTDFLIDGIKFRNAICFEATCQEIYNGDVQFVIATSNNGWFIPSIEPTLQNLLLHFYAKKNNVIIYHSANMAGSEVIKP